MPTIGLLKNTVQKYAWGSTSAIQEFLGEKNFSHGPVAELWMGAHPKSPSLVNWDGQWTALNDLIAQNPQALLGNRVAKKFDNQLPYLFKVLAAAKPLSIQAHPGLDQAAKGFEIETNRGIPINAAHRNYKDANHKPECLCALSSFQALYGFRRIADILSLVGKICPVGLSTELDHLKKHADPGGLKIFFTKLMSMETAQKVRVIDEATQKAKQRSAQDPAFHWTAKLAVDYPLDMGILSPLFLNLIRLKPGQALFLPAGELHSYLDGTGIELMANSDNVLRGGLTTKHVDVPELLRVLNFKPRRIEILKQKKINKTEKIYDSFAEEFVLSALSISDGDLYQKSNIDSAEILLCTEGEAYLEDSSSNHIFHIKRGDSAIIFATAKSYTLKGNAVCYKAAVPV
ncbi:MAG: mannose-6-phosphate isomerase, class I [Desulfobacteraceae bacterium]|jgi:mannose-6-phosphate isomerase|nr:mannose-6-phosphate isomerase, class I [Desulfobacteraceae bacterium]